MHGNYLTLYFFIETILYIEKSVFTKNSYQILFVLFDGEFSVGDLAASLSMTQSAISHQLKVLKTNKLVKSRRDGKLMFYSLADEHVRGIIAMGREHIEEQ